MSGKTASPWPRSQGLAWSLRTVLMASLLVFSLLPAATVGWFLYRSNMHSVHALSEKTVEDVAQRVRTETETHLLQAHQVLNGLIPEYPGESALVRARQLVQTPALFEQSAFVMMGMMQDVSTIHLGARQGFFWGVEVASRDGVRQLRVSERQPGKEIERFFWADSAGDRRAAAPPAQTFSGQSWYRAALAQKGRTFSPVAVADGQLQLTLAQPVYGTDGDALGVFAVDLPLQPLGQMLQRTRISPHGAVFVIDEQGFVVASSTGDELFSGAGTTLARHTPANSLSPVVRSAYADAAPRLGKTHESSVQREAFLRRVPMQGDTLMVALKPFGENRGVHWSLVVAAPESDFTQGAMAALQKTLLVTALTLVLGALLAVALAYRIGRSFRLLTDAAEQLAQAEVPPVQSAAHIIEVRQLSQTLHDSAEELQYNQAAIEAHTDALYQANETLEARVAERTAELSASREEALSSARAKAAFLATMSHEIRTPLNGIVGMTTLLIDTALNAEQRDYVQTMRVSSDQLLAVINDILDFSKIESGRLELEHEPLNLLATIEEACDIGAPRAREKGLELRVDMSDELPAWVRGDVTRLRQVLLNLINNAVKFTERGQVIVSAHVVQDFVPEQGGLVEFQVQDTGIGIPAERQTALFESFVQVDAGTTRRYGGTGLGLAICKRLVKLMGGSVGLRSVQGQGSTFWFTARLGYTDAPEASRLTALNMVSLAGKRVVVVDDAPVNLRILNKQLRRWGVEPILFEHAPEALTWLQSHSADVLLTDMHMHRMDGEALARSVRALHPALPIVLLSSGAMPSGDQAHVFDVRLLKPYRQSRLFEALALVTGQSEAPAPSAKHELRTGGHQLILVADDNVINLKVALAMLAILGYEAETAINGREAAELVAGSLNKDSDQMPRPYAAILMDVNMPVMDGCTASNQIISRHGALAPPIIALSASVLEEDRQRCLASGMIDFLPKPLRIDELSTVLARHVSPSGPSASEVAAAAAVVHLPPDPAPEPPPGLVLMDWRRLAQFREFDDKNLTMTQEVVALFIREMPRRMNDISLALATGDSAVLSRAGHALKGAASNMGAQALGNACAALEQSSRNGQWPADAPAQVARIGTLTEQTHQVLSDWQAERAAAAAAEPASVPEPGVHA